MAVGAEPAPVRGPRADHTPRWCGPWAGAVMIGGMGTSAHAGDAPAGQGHTPYLPEPTGPRPVGTTSLCLKDLSRPDPWAAGVSARELMVSLWYPATPSDGRRARYMTPAESGLLLASRGLTSVPPPRRALARLHHAPQHAHRPRRGPSQPRLRRGRS